MKIFRKGNRRTSVRGISQVRGLHRSATMNEVCITYNKFEDLGLVGKDSNTSKISLTVVVGKD